MLKKIACTILMLGAVAFGQHITPVKAAEQPSKPAVTASKPDVAPQLSETEKIALSALAEKMQEIEKARQNILQHLSAIQADIEHAHPGYRFDARTGQLQPIESPAKK